ncbi:MAG: 2-hydroxyacyl-CoA dehydratase [Firmicutes bacterium]|nr:2-hydroxyacyl-CoA dehydratase [Bacillota bacterium]MBR5926237.1 2-hydroxyacyl-CoA dehydratase [Bacillota bacterium]MBR6025180.1 2-hydroxyacyl-CoA dehydratase [Bacillota bacterium]
MSDVLNRLHETANSPKAQFDKYLAEGKKVVGVVPVYTPQELIHSMGLVPFGVWGGDLQINESKKYFPAFICSIMQTILELGIGGAYKGMSALVIPALCDSLKCLGQNWKYSVKDIPFIQMQYPQNRKPEFGIEFTKSAYERVIEDLKKYTGAEFSEEKLAESIKVYNEHNAVMREFEELASVKTISAQHRSDVFKSAWFMLPEEHTALVKQLNEELKAAADDTTSVRVLTSGILADAPELLKHFDENGIKIVWDDVAAESRQYYTDTKSGRGPLADLAVKFADMGNCSVLYDVEKKRVDFILENAAKHNAKAVVVLMTKFCDPEEFDYVLIKNACDKAGLAHLNIEVDRQMQSYGQAATMLEALKEM